MHLVRCSAVKELPEFSLWFKWSESVACLTCLLKSTRRIYFIRVQWHMIWRTVVEMGSWCFINTFKMLKDYWNWLLTGVHTLLTGCSQQRLVLLLFSCDAAVTHEMSVCVCVSLCNLLYKHPRKTMFPLRFCNEMHLAGLKGSQSTTATTGMHWTTFRSEIFLRLREQNVTV